MAIRFDIKKYEQIKKEYLKYLETGSASASLLRDFESYKLYLDADSDVMSKRATFSSKQKEKKENKQKPKVPPVLSTSQEYDSLVKQISELTQELKQSDFVSLEQKQKIDHLHHNIIFAKDFTAKQQLKINQSILNLQNFVNLIECEKRRRHITEQLEVLKKLTMEDGFVEKRKSIRSQIKTSKTLLFEDVKVLLHRLNQTVPYTPKNEQKVDRQPELPIMQPSKAEEQVIAWTQIVFGNNVIRITDKNGKFLFAPKANCLKSYNKIKEYLANKLPQIVVIRNDNGIWTLKEPIVFKEALLMIKNKESEELIQEEQYRCALRSFATMEEYLQYRQNQERVIEGLKEKKQGFLNYLIKYQINDYKLIPAIEMIAHESSESVFEEDVFIFTIPYKLFRTGVECVNIVYENVNEARATIVCTVEKRYYTQALQSLFNFMNDENQKNKRSRLHQTLRLNNSVRNLHVVNHTDMHTWATYVQR